ncbi:MAG: nucleotidyltransferase family protein [Bacillota bacterium]|nr:nucleotidyltransferase family protein [Bacillota bacterium]
MRGEDLGRKIEALPDEMKLFLLCSIKDIPVEQEEKIRDILGAGISWDDFLIIVERHRVYMTVYRQLTRIHSENVNSRALNELHRISQRKVMQSVRLASELVNVARLLEDSDISVISLKGPLLSINIYGDIAYRSSKDLDILISEHDIDKADKLLLANGFRRIDADACFSPKQKAYLIRTRQHFVYQNKDRVIIEMHWRVSSGNTVFHFDELWKNRKGSELSGQTINVLSDEDEFLYLLFHGSAHGYSRLRWLCDIAEIIKKDKLPWGRILKRVTEMNIMEMLVQTVILVENLLHIEIPEALRASLVTSRTGQKMALQAISIMTETDESSMQGGSFFNNRIWKYNMLRSKGLRSKLEFFVNRFRPALIDLNTIHFSDRFFFMYYLVRPFLKVYRSIIRRS